MTGIFFDSGRTNTNAIRKILNIVSVKWDADRYVNKVYLSMISCEFEGLSSSNAWIFIGLALNTSNIVTRLEVFRASQQLSHYLFLVFQTSFDQMMGVRKQLSSIVEGVEIKEGYTTHLAPTGRIFASHLFIAHLVQFSATSSQLVCSHHFPSFWVIQFCRCFQNKSICWRECISLWYIPKFSAHLVILKYVYLLPNARKKI